MSSLSITHYFPFPRVRILRQRVSSDAQRAYLEAIPDRRFRPICHVCGRQATGIHSQESRWVRDLDFGPARVWILCHYRKVLCEHCQKKPIEELDLFDPYMRVTKRLAFYIFELCKIMTVQEVSRHLGLDWKTVKAVDQKFLERDYGFKQSQYLQIDPLICPQCGGRMRIISFIEDHKVIDKIIAHLKLTFYAERPPPPQIVQQELLMAAEERGEYF